MKQKIKKLIEGKEIELGDLDIGDLSEVKKSPKKLGEAFIDLFAEFIKHFGNEKELKEDIEKYKFHYYNLDKWISVYRESELRFGNQYLVEKTCRYVTEHKLKILEFVDICQEVFDL